MHFSQIFCCIFDVIILDEAQICKVKNIFTIMNYSAASSRVVHHFYRRLDYFIKPFYIYIYITVRIACLRALI